MSMPKDGNAISLDGDLFPSLGKAIRMDGAQDAGQRVVGRSPAVAGPKTNSGKLPASGGGKLPAHGQAQGGALGGAIPLGQQTQPAAQPQMLPQSAPAQSPAMGAAQEQDLGDAYLVEMEGVNPRTGEKLAASYEAVFPAGTKILGVKATPQRR